MENINQEFACNTCCTLTCKEDGGHPETGLCESCQLDKATEEAEAKEEAARADNADTRCRISFAIATIERAHPGLGFSDLLEVLEELCREVLKRDNINWARIEGLKEEIEDFSEGLGKLSASDVQRALDSVEALCPLKFIRE